MSKQLITGRIYQLEFKDESFFEFIMWVLASFECLAQIREPMGLGGDPVDLGP